MLLGDLQSPTYKETGVNVPCCAMNVTITGALGVPNQAHCCTGRGACSAADFTVLFPRAAQPGSSSPDPQSTRAFAQSRPVAGCREVAKQTVCRCPMFARCPESYSWEMLQGHTPNPTQCTKKGLCAGELQQKQILLGYSGL